MASIAIFTINYVLTRVATSTSLCDFDATRVTGTFVTYLLAVVLSRAAFFPIFMRLVTSQGPGHNVSSQVAHSVKQFLEFLWSWQPITNKLEMAPKFKQFFFHFSFFLVCSRVHFVGGKKRKGVGRRKGSAHTQKLCTKLDFSPFCNSCQ